MHILSATSAAALIVASLTSQTGSLSGRPVPALDLEVTDQTRLLVVAPHPDDEALGAAGLIARVAAHGGAVRLVLLTSGDGFPEAVEAADGVRSPTPMEYRDFGVVRERETRSAMTRLGVRPDAISFLGFPDEGLCLLASRYLFDRRRSFESPYTDRVRPPAGEQIVRNARYRGVDVRRELERLVSEFAPTVIVVPHPDDEHPDHCSTHIFMRETLEAVRLKRPGLRVLHYLVHYRQWPEQDGEPAGALATPGQFTAEEGRWVSLDLTPTEARLKREAIDTYASQLRIIGRFMHSFATDNERYLEGEPRSMHECWCDGQNIAIHANPTQHRRSR